MLNSICYYKNYPFLLEHQQAGDRICKPFKEPRNRFQDWRARTITLFVVPACQATRLAKSIPLKRFLGSLNVYKYGLWAAAPELTEKLESVQNLSLIYLSVKRYKWAPTSILQHAPFVLLLYVCSCASTLNLLQLYIVIDHAMKVYEASTR
jgi:hypothetical protein